MAIVYTFVKRAGAPSGTIRFVIAGAEYLINDTSQSSFTTTSYAAASTLVDSPYLRLASQTGAFVPPPEIRDVFMANGLLAYGDRLDPTYLDITGNGGPVVPPPDSTPGPVNGIITSPFRHRLAEIGSGAYSLDYNNADAWTVATPLAGTTQSVVVPLDATGQFTSGDFHFITNTSTGTGLVQLVAGPGVTIIAAISGIHTLGAGQSWVLRYYKNNIWHVEGGSISTPPTQAPVKTADPVISYNSGTGKYQVDANGQTNPAFTSITYQWQRETTLNAGNWTDISTGTGFTTSQYTKVTADENHRVRVNVTFTVSGTTLGPYPSNPINVPAAAAPSFATGFPKIVLASSGADVPNGGVEIGTQVKIDLGTVTGTGNTFSVEYFNPDAATPPTIISRGVTTTSPYTYTTVSGDSGTNGDEHIYATVTATNASGQAVKDTPWVAVVPVGSTVTPPTTGDPGTGRVSYFLQPFGSTSFWNTSLGSGANFQTPTGNTVLGPGQNASDQITAFNSPFINSTQYNVIPTLAVTGDPLATWTDTRHGSITKQVKTPNKPSEPGGVIAVGSDQTVTVTDPTQTQTDDGWLGVKNSSTSYSFGYMTKATINESGTGIGGGIRAAQFPSIGGVIRTWEVVAGSINHILVAILPANRMLSGWVWPAISEDQYGPTSYGPYGQCRMGSLFGIPPSVNVAGLGLTAGGLILAHCLQDYGLRISDSGAPGQGGTLVLVGEQGIASNTTYQQMLSDWQAAKIHKSLRLITNDSSNNIGGGGVRRKPALGTVVGGTSTATSVQMQTSEAWNDSGNTYAASAYARWGANVANNSNRVFYFAVCWGGLTPLDTSQVVDATTSAVLATATLVSSVTVGADFTARTVAVYRYVNPSAIQQDALVMTSGNQDMGLIVIPLWNVNQATPERTIGAGNKATTSAGTSLATSGITSAASDLILSFACIRSTGTDASINNSGAGQTMRTNKLIGTNLRMIGWTQPGAATVGTSFSWVGSDKGVLITIPVQSA